MDGPRPPATDDGERGDRRRPARATVSPLSAGSLENIERSWIDEHGFAAGETLWEVYITEPSPDMDPSELRTELNWALA